MPIEIQLDLLLVQKKKKSKEVALALGITEQNLSILKTGKAKAIRLSTLESLCRILECQPGDLLKYTENHPIAASHLLINSSCDRV